MELISIVDCDLCVKLPADQKVSELPLLETWGRLSTILVRGGWDEPWSADLARYSSALDIDIEQIRVCRPCGTHYHYRQVHDPHFGEPREPETDWFLWRLAPSDARDCYIDHTGPNGVVDHLDGGWLARRYQTIIGLLRRDVTRAPDWQIKQYMVEALYRHYVSDQDWEGLRATLIDCPDPAVGVGVARRIFETMDPEHPGRRLARSTRYWDNLGALLGAEPTREPSLVAVLAAGLSAQGQIMQYFYPTGWEPVTVAGHALYTLRTYVPRQSLAPAIPAVAAVLQEPDPARRWLRERARDFLVEYVDAAPKMANQVLRALGGDTDETLAVRIHCQRCLARSASRRTHGG
jgi:hypothetical protein